MKRARRALGAGFAVAAAVAFTVTPPAVSQTDPCAPTNGDGTRIDGTLDSPTPNFVAPTADVAVKASGFRYRDQSQLFNEADVTELTAQLILCGDTGRVLPEPSSAQKTTGGEPMSIDWNSALPYNGGYALRLTAKASNGAQRVIVRPFAVDAPAQKPANVKTSVAAEGGAVTVAWDANPEPDIAGYAVEWTSDPDGDFADAKLATIEPASGVRQSFTHEPGLGTWRYRVTAARYGTTRSDLNASEPSTAPSATIDPPPTTTAPQGTSAAGSGSSAPTTAASTGAPATSAPQSSGGTSVDLKRFSQLLDQRRTATPKPAPEPDSGFQEVLPFKPGDEPVVASVDESAADAELGSTQQIITDDSDRRRAMAFVASGLLAFVVALGMRMVKAAADRMPDLEVTESEAVDTEGTVVEHEPAPHDLEVTAVLDQAPGTVELRRRRRASVAERGAQVSSPAEAAPATPSRRDARQRARGGSAPATNGQAHDITTDNPELRDLDLGVAAAPAAAASGMPLPRRHGGPVDADLDVPMQPAPRRRRRAPVG